jgi:acetyl esterase/lipase
VGRVTDAAAVIVTELSIAGPHGTIPVRHYGTGTSASAPALVWMHGGAYALGDLDMAEGDWVSRELAARGIRVVSVDYRLAPRIDIADLTAPPSAPGAHFPVASEEVAAAFHWTLEHAGELGADPERVSIGGASAGANLAAGVTLRLRDAGGPQARTALLVYPALHAVLPEPSAELAAKLDGLPPVISFPPADLRAINLNYVGDEAELANPYAFPGGHDLRGLPPAFIITADRDRLRTSGEAYAAELAAAGVDTLVLRENGTRHGYLNDPEHPSALASIERMAAWLHLGPLVGTRHSDAVPAAERTEKS